MMPRTPKRCATIQNAFSDPELKYKDSLVKIAQQQDLVSAAAKDPVKALETEDYWKTLPSAGKIRDVATSKDNLTSAINDDRKGAFNSVHLFMAADRLKDKPYKDELLQSAFKKLEAAGQTDILYNSLVSHMNEQHDKDDSKRFACVDNKQFDAGRLYDLLSKNTDGIYTSTFNGLLGRFLNKAKDENLDFGKFLQDPKHSDSLPALLQEAAARGRFNEVFDKIPKDQQQDVIDRMVKDVAASGDVSKGAALAEISKHIDPSLTKGFEKALAESYESSKDEKKKDVLGLVAGAYADSHKDAVNYKQFFDSLKDNDRYHLPDANKVDPSKLYDDKGRHFQIMRFYNDVDKDGEHSFQSFMNTYKQHPGEWNIKNHDTYVEITSKGGNKSLTILANKPDCDGSNPTKDGVKDIAKHMESLNPPYDGNVSLIHRGHSFHAEETIKSVNDKTSFVFLGSCGGAKEIEQVLKKNPDISPPIATRGTGTMNVNDPLLYRINEAIVKGDGVDWNKIMDTKVGDKRKEDYVKPSDNTGALIIAKYYQDHPEDRDKPKDQPGQDHRSQAVADPRKDAPAQTPAATNPPQQQQNSRAPAAPPA